MSTVAVPLLPKEQYDNNLIVVLDGNGVEVSLSSKSHDPKVIGITTDYDNAEIGLCGFGEIPFPLVAVTGRVMCQVRGPIGFGDCIVTSDNAGIGQKLDTAKYVPGCIVAKSLGEIKDNNVHLIEVVLTTA